MSDKRGIPARTYGGIEVQLRESLFTRALVLPIQEFIHIQGISSVLLLAAAIAALDGVAPRKIDGAAIRAEMNREGAELA